jgi:RNA polymerase sigma-70 factor (ECF subfamily)
MTDSVSPSGGFTTERNELGEMRVMYRHQAVTVDDMATQEGNVTALLRALRHGDREAGEKLFPLVYTELHRLARSYMRRERQNHTLQPTALINEAYVRLAQASVEWQSRAHFIAVAANAMRRILVDHARAHAAAIRGGA